MRSTSRFNYLFIARFVRDYTKSGNSVVCFFPFCIKDELLLHLFAARSLPQKRSIDPCHSSTVNVMYTDDMCVTYLSQQHTHRILRSCMSLFLIASRGVHTEADRNSRVPFVAAATECRPPRTDDSLIGVVCTFGRASTYV